MDIYKERIRPLFNQSGLQDKQLEELFNLPRGVIYKWGTGKYKSYQKYIYQFSTHFHVSADYLLGKTDNPSPINQTEKLPAQGGELSDVQKEAIQFIKGLSDEQLARFIKMGQAAFDEGGGKV